MQVFVTRWFFRGALWLALGFLGLQFVLPLLPKEVHASTVWPRPLIPPLPASEPAVSDPVVSLDGTWYWSKTPPTNFQSNSVDPSTDPTNWKQVPVPADLGYLGDWPAGYCRTNCGGQDVDYPYKQSFLIPSSFAGSEIFLRFNAVFSEATVWVNGTQVGTHRGAYSTWVVDITNAVTPGQNAWVTVGVTAESHTPAYSQVRGISRDVSLVALPKNYAMRLQATTTFDSTYTNATLNVDSGVVFNGGTNASINLQLLDPSGHSVALSPNSISVSASSPESSVSIPVTAPLKWDAEHPNLYALTATYVVDGTIVETVNENIGFRQIVVSGNQVLVNGNPVKLRGADYLPMAAGNGLAETSAEEIHDLQEFKAANINYIRTSHFAPDETFLNEADQLGIYVEYETSLAFDDQVGNASDSTWEPEYVGQFAENIETDQTHPSILYWSLGNESQWGTNMDQMVQYAAQADPTRPTKFSWGNNVPAGETSIYSEHYPGPGEGGLTGSSEPVINDEYAHGFTVYTSPSPTNTTAFDPGVRDWYGEYLRDYWEPIYTTQGQLGGAMWNGKDSVDEAPAGGFDTARDWGTMLDAWGREKPEYYNVQKDYTPDYIVDGPVANPGAGQPLVISITNRHDSTNLSELTIHYQAGSASGNLTGVNVAPHANGTLTIPAQNWTDGEIVNLTFTNNTLGYQEDSYNLPIGQPEITFAGPTGTAPTITSDSSSLTVSNSTFGLTFSTSTGMITSGTYNGTTVLTGGPFLNLGNVSLPGSWTLSSITSSTSGSEALVTIAGTYGTTGVTYVLHIDGTGLIRTAYTVTSPPNGYTEVGVGYDVTSSANTLDWQRQGLWSSYPSDNIGRNVGTAPEHKTSGTDTYGVKPSWSWSQDETDYVNFGVNDPANRGTNDFRSSKTNFYYGSLVVSGSQARLQAEGDGTGSVRAAVDGSNLRLNINNLWSVTNQAVSCCDSDTKTISIGSSYSNMVQMRLTNSDTAGMTTTYSDAAVNLAPQATVSAPGLTGDAISIQDNDPNTGAVSPNGPAFPQDITYTWPTGQNFNQLALVVGSGQGQGITNVLVQVSADGSTNWTTVANSGTLTYTTNNLETQTINIPQQTNMKGVRIQINSANLQWSHYALSELQVFNAPPPPNLALTATLSAPGLTGNAQVIQDGNPTTGTVSTDNPAFPQYITYTWPTGQTFNQIQLVTGSGEGQGITNVNVQVSADGSTNWTQVASSGTMTYTTNNLETQTINFPTQTNMKGVRIQINAANLQWSHYALNEFQVSNGPPPYNLALSASLSAPGLTGNVQVIQDGDPTTGTVSPQSPTFPQYITYTWPTGQSFNQIQLVTGSGQGQGITNVTVQVSADGSTNWTQVASSGTMTYASNNLVTQTINFAPQTNMEGVRIQINAANLTWGHYALNEFDVYNAAPSNLAFSATVSAPGLTGSVQSIQDSNATSGTVSQQNPTFPQDITYTWPSGQTVDQVVLETTWGQGQGITNVTVQVSTDGTTWTQVASSGTMTYATNSGNVEAQVITFSAQTNIVGLRIQINGANLQWSHYALTEFDVYNI